MSITRIQNNQITDSTIVAYAKLQAGSLTGNLFAPSVTLNSNVTINGNLFLANTGNTTTINATNTYINDPVVVFNNGYSGSLSGYDIGMLVNRNLTSLASYGSVNTAWVWSEADGAFVAIATTDTGTGSTSINNSGYANVKIGNSTITGSQSITGSLTVVGTINTTGATTFTTATIGGLQAVAIGNVTPGTGAFTTLSTSGVTLHGGNVVVTSGVDTTSTTTGALMLTGSGGAMIGGNAYVGNNLYIGPSAFSQTFAAPTIVAVDNGSNYAQIAMKNTNSAGSADYAAYADNGDDNGGWVDMGVAGSSFADGRYTITKAQDGYLITRPTSNTYGGNLVIGTSEAGSYNDVTISVGSFFSNAEVARFHGNATTSGYLALKQGTASTSTTSGALQVTGGVGVSGAIYAGSIQNTPIGSTTASTGVFTTGTFNTSATVNGTLIATTINAPTIGNVGAKLYGDGGFLSNIIAGNVSGTLTTANVSYYEVLTNSTTNATFYPSFFDKATGNAAAYTNTSLNFNPSTGTLAASAFSGGTGSFTTLGASGIVSFTNATNNTGTGTGALRVTGGAWIGGNLWIDGNLNLATSTTVTSPSGVFTGNAAGFGALYAGINTGYVFQPQTVLQNSTNFNGYAQVNHQNINSGSLASSDYVATANNGTADDTYIDMGIASSTYNYPAFGIIKPNDGYLLVLGNTTTGGGNLVLTSGRNDIVFAPGGSNANNEYGRINTSNVFVIRSSVAATSEYTGAMTVAGGIGIAGALYTGGIGKHGAGLQNTPIGNATPSTAAFTTLTASGITTLTNSTAATNSGTGALQVTGGASIGGNLWVGGNVYAGNIIGTTQSVITVQDPLLYLQANTPSGAYSYDIGFYSDYTAPYYVHSGLARNFNTNVWTFFSNVASEPTATGINWSDAGIAYDSVKAGSLTLANSTAASSTSTGALVVTGGAGVGGALYAGSVYDNGNRVLTSFSSSGAGNLTVSISAPGSSTIALPSTGPGATTTGSGSLIPVITTDAYGRIASISTAAPVGSAVTGTVTTANVALYEQLTNSTTNATFYPSFFDKATGNALPYTNTSLNFNPSTGTLSATNFSGTVTGTVATANVALYEQLTNSTTNATFYPAFFDKATGNALPYTNTSVNVNPSTGTLSATQFVGGGAGLTGLTGSQVIGTVVTANVALYEQLTNSTTNATFYPAFFDKATGNALPYTNTSLNFNPSTGSLSATSFSGSFVGSGSFSTVTTSSTIISSGNIVAAATSATNDNNTGALIAKGGIAAAGNINVGVGIYVGTGAQATLLTNPTAVFVGTDSAGVGQQYMQVAAKNITNIGSSDFIAYANNYAGPSNDHGWADMGFTGDAFNDALYSITGKNDGYLFASGANATVGGNLVLATDWTGGFNDIVFASGSFYANSEVARFHGNTSNSGTFVLKLPTQNTTAANTGAFQVWGGASFSGNVYHGGGAIFNGSQTSNYDFKVAGVGTTNLIWARPNTTYDTVIIGDTLSASSLVNGAKLYINSTDSVILPTGTNAQRPGVAGGTTAVTGMLRYNTTSNGLEFYNGSSWQAPSSTITVITDQQFTATGSTATFTLSSSATTASTIVSINGVLQIPTLAYSVSGTALTFTENPANGDVIDVRVLTTTSTVTQLNDVSGFNSIQTLSAGSTNGNTAIVFTTGLSGGSQTTQYAINTDGAFVTYSPNVTVVSSGVATVVDNLFANTYSSAEYTITATMQGTNIRQIDKVHLIHSGDATGAGTTTVMVYGTVNTAGNNLVSYTGVTSGNIAQLKATTTNANTILRIKRNYQAI